MDCGQSGSGGERLLRTGVPAALLLVAVRSPIIRMSGLPTQRTLTLHPSLTQSNTMAHRLQGILAQLAPMPHSNLAPIRPQQIGSRCTAAAAASTTGQNEHADGRVWVGRCSASATQLIIMRIDACV